MLGKKRGTFTCTLDIAQRKCLLDVRGVFWPNIVRNNILLRERERVMKPLLVLTERRRGGELATFSE